MPSLNFDSNSTDSISIVSRDSRETTRSEPIPVSPSTPSSIPALSILDPKPRLAGIRRKSSTFKAAKSIARIVQVPGIGGIDLKDAMISCALCQRRVGLWAFTAPLKQPSVSSPLAGTIPESASNPSITTLDETPPAEVVQPITRQLDVLREHRSFCPYVIRTTETTLPPILSPLPISVSALRQENEKSVSTAAVQDVEGWKAVLNVVSRCGLGGRRRSQIATSMFGAGDKGADGDGDGDDDGAEKTVDSLVDRVRRTPSGSRDLLRYVKGLLA